MEVKIMFRRFTVLLAMLIAGTGGLFASGSAYAVPSFARQTGMTCSSCHTIFPKLTAFGRMFKLDGYTMTGVPQIQQDDSKAAPGMKINAPAPVSAMVQVGLTHVNNPDANTENNNVTFPTALSLYYAGEISPHMGTFLQVTMDGAKSSFGFDMADIRYANSTSTKGGTSITYGLTLDNMTGMEDVWNTTPSWTYPFLAGSPDHGDSPAVNSLMGGGLGAYALVDNQWYGYLSIYNPMSNQKTMYDGTMYMGNPHAENPYWRLAWQGDIGSSDYLEVGTYGTVVQVYGSSMMSQAAAIAKSDKFTDTALDAQYEHPVGDNNQLNAHAVYIREKQSLDASNTAAPSQNMTHSRADVAYIVGGRFQYQIGYFSTTADSGAYAFDGMNTAAFGGDNKGYVAEFDYLPWENTKFSLQYTGFNTFGGTTNNATDNNTLLANAWFMW